MFKTTKTGADTVELEMSSRLFAGGAIFFLALGGIDVVAGLLSSHPGNTLGAGIASLFVGAVWGFMPHRVVVKVDRTLGELTRTSRALFRNSEVTEKLGEFECVAIQAATYSWFFNAVRNNGMVLPLFSQRKTWSSTKAPTPEVTARAKEIADALGLPLRPAA